MTSRIVFNYNYMQDIVNFCLQTLKDNSPIGSVHDSHPGLYRDSHMVFFNGHVTTDVSNWMAGDEIDISNPAPYSRKIENIDIPGHVYEKSYDIIKAKYGEQVKIIFTYMPVRFGDVGAFVQFSGKLVGKGHKASLKEKRDWLVHQPVIQIRGL